MMRRKGTAATTPIKNSGSNTNNSSNNNTAVKRPLATATASSFSTASMVASSTSLSLISVLTLAVLWYVYAVVHVQLQTSLTDARLKRAEQHSIQLPFLKKQQQNNNLDLLQPLPSPEDNNNNDDATVHSIPSAFEAVYQRAQQNAQHCQSLDNNNNNNNNNNHNQSFVWDNRTSMIFHNESLATLPVFGFIHDYQAYQQPQLQQQQQPQDPSSFSTHNSWNCQLPPETECQEHHLSIIFMAYNPDRLEKLLKQIHVFLTDPDWQLLVAEIVLVWNGERSVGETATGARLLAFTQTHPLRVVYPLQQGLQNDLLNRYHPDIVQVTTKAILYYDDDGPFYSFAAVQAGFELWKRHSQAQIGAMARELTYGKRQQEWHAKELLRNTQTHNDQAFVPHCPNLGDRVDYNYRYFANYDANMVLPSGSILHANYLCFLWHPLLANIRKFVQAHPVHPDDITVSTIVSQLAGRAPRVYSRRLNPPSKEERAVMDEYQAKKQAGPDGALQRRRLNEEPHQQSTVSNQTRIVSNTHYPNRPSLDVEERLRHRRLMFGINWDAKGGMDHNKQLWADLRTQAINALTQYFGSLNSGSIGWCEPDSPYYAPKKDGRCQPVMAKMGQLSWMQPNGKPKETCP